jgi:hypothetical protein
MLRPKAEGLVFRLESKIYKALRQNNHVKQKAGTPKEANGWNTGHIDRYVKQRQTVNRVNDTHHQRAKIEDGANIAVE